MNRRQFITTAVGATAAVAACPVIASPPPIDERLTRMFSHLHPGTFLRKLCRPAGSAPHCFVSERRDGYGEVTFVSAYSCLRHGHGVPSPLWEPTLEQMLQNHPGAHLRHVSIGRNIFDVGGPVTDTPVYVAGSAYCALQYVLPDQTLFVLEYGKRDPASAGPASDEIEKWKDAQNLCVHGPLVDLALASSAFFTRSAS